MFCPTSRRGGSTFKLNRERDPGRLPIARPHAHCDSVKCADFHPVIFFNRSTMDPHPSPLGNRIPPRRHPEVLFPNRAMSVLHRRSLTNVRGLHHPPVFQYLTARHIEGVSTALVAAPRTGRGEPAPRRNWRATRRNDVPGGPCVPGCGCCHRCEKRPRLRQPRPRAWCVPHESPKRSPGAEESESRG